MKKIIDNIKQNINPDDFDIGNFTPAKINLLKIASKIIILIIQFKIKQLIFKLIGINISFKKIIIKIIIN